MKIINFFLLLGIFSMFACDHQTSLPASLGVNAKTVKSGDFSAVDFLSCSINNPDIPEASLPLASLNSVTLTRRKAGDAFTSRDTSIIFTMATSYISFPTFSKDSARLSLAIYHGIEVDSQGNYLRAAQLVWHTILVTKDGKEFIDKPFDFTDMDPFSPDNPLKDRWREVEIDKNGRPEFIGQDLRYLGTVQGYTFGCGIDNSKYPDYDSDEPSETNISEH